MRYPRDGAPVCPRHGGHAPQVIAAAERRRQARDAVLALESFGVPIETDPQSALLDELYRTVGAVAWLGAIVAGLDRAEIGWGVTEAVDKASGEFPGTDTTRAARPNVWVSMWQAERKHLVDVSSACLKAGIEERMLRVAEGQAMALAAVISAVLGRLELSPGQQELVPGVVAEELQAVALGGTGGAGAERAS